MSDTKKMIKTFGVLLGVLVIIFIVLLIFMAIAGSKVGNTQLVNIVENAGKRYYASHDSELPTLDSSAKISTEKLISEKYMKPFNKITKNTNCSGEVVVYNNGGEYLYVPFVKCNEYKTTTIGEVLKEKVVTSGDGLYNDNGTYYYRGEYVDNYIKIGNNTYRILSMDNDNIKVIDTKLSSESYAWDNRYNIERDESGLGINDYSKSRLRESLANLYEKVDQNVKKYIIKTDWCVDKKSSSNDSLNFNNCIEKIFDYLGTVTANEYARISIDENCNSLFDHSCKNYNYFIKQYDRNIWTSTAVNDNSYMAYNITSGSVEEKKTYNEYKIVVAFNINSNSTYVSGNGTNDNPYIIR